MTHSVSTKQPAAWRRAVKRHPLVSFFTLALSLSWIAWIPFILSEHGLGLVGLSVPLPQLTLMLPGAYLGPIFSAFFVTAIADGRAGVRRWAGRILKWRVKWSWYALAVLGVPVALFLCGLPFSGGDVQMPPLWVFAAYIPSLILQFLTTGIAEEPGWRDFALPRMQPYFGPLRGTVILGVIWGIWHLPLYLTSWGGYPHVTWDAPLEFVISCIAISIVMTWVFNRTGESLPVAILLHASVNNTMSIVAAAVFPSIGSSHAAAAQVVLLASCLAAAAVLIGTKGKLGYKPAAVAEPLESEAAPQNGPEPTAEARH